VNDPSTLTFCRWVIGITFALSALGKARAMASFRGSVAEFAILPARLTDPVAVVAVGAEILIVLLMAVGGWWVPAGFVLALGLLAAFSAALVVALRRRDEVSCNCFGPVQRPISWYDIARNAALGLCCLAGLWSDQVVTARHLPLALVLVLGLMAATFSTIVTNLSDIVELLRRPYVVD
jgi:hypothetical protein